MLPNRGAGGLTRVMASRIDADQSGITADSVVGARATYRCPNTGFPMQASAAEEITEDKDRYEPVSCVRCWEPFHLVNPFTGKVFGDDDDRSRAKLPHVSSD